MRAIKVMSRIGKIGVVTVVMLICIQSGLSKTYVSATKLESTGSEDVNASIFPNCRFGVGASSQTQANYDITGMNFGAYMNWESSVAPYSFGGAEYFQMIQINETGYTPSGGALSDRIIANPGSIWLVGNEPDHNNPLKTYDLYPDVYAERYHDVYTFIKSVDPTARVSAGGIVQPTIARLTWLNYVLSAYFNRYGTSMPVDVWNIHNYNYDETSTSGAQGVPHGVDPALATYADIYDVDDIDVFEAHLVTFRTWMRDHGYRNTPLVITEFGNPWPYYNYPQDPILCETLPDNSLDCFDEDRASEFMAATFDYLTTATDPNIGYPADNNHLVQQWLWFHMDSTAWGGLLFDPATNQPMQLGLDWKAYVGQIAPAQDLIAVRVQQVHPVLYSGVPVSVILSARLSNAGNVPVQDMVEVRFTDGDSQIIGSPQMINMDLNGCGGFVDVTTTWSGLVAGTYDVSVTVDYGGVVTETLESNNTTTTKVLVALHQLYLPMSLRIRSVN